MDGDIPVRITCNGCVTLDCWQHVVGGEVVEYVGADGVAIGIPELREEAVTGPMVESL